MSYFIGAYASSPCTSGWDPALESEYYAQLKTLPKLKGLEHPFLGQHLHGHDDGWFLDNIDPAWQFLITCIPGTMAAIGENPTFGIASEDQDGREQALQFFARARDAIAKLNEHSGRKAVDAIAIHTAPNQARTKASADALQASLETMLTWDWQGARILIEHCDTYVEGQTPAKGFLSLEDEIHTINALNPGLSHPLGMIINWGRSVIETRHCDGALEHILQAKEAGVLAGLMFSGVSGIEGPYGQWADTHMPHAHSERASTGADGSLMTESEIVRCARAADAGSLDVLGVKLGIRPKDESIENRIAYNRDALSMIDRAL